ncbi:MAG: hypothetical protein HYS26_04155 [Candidatus Kaiserbacteria bacterium]|nr:MAG: hypothetical protein HYS26_04155 [Candidatus Kaiserbacteria bacterium]
MTRSLTEGNFLSLAVSGQRFTFRNNMFTNLAGSLPRIYPCSSGVDLVFIDLLRALPRGTLNCPLLWNDGEWSVDPLARLLKDWSEMVQVMRRIIAERITPLLQRGIKVVAIFHGFGLNLLLHAAVTPEFKLDHPVINQVYEIHGGLVKTFFKHFSPPEYLIAEADAEAVASRMARENPSLAAIPHLQRVKFSKFEESAIRAYPTLVPMQKPFHFIKASFTEAEMTAYAQDVVIDRIETFRNRAGCTPRVLSA